MRASEVSKGSCQNGVINKYRAAKAMIMGTISQTCCTEDTVSICTLLYVALVHLLNYI